MKKIAVYGLNNFSCILVNTCVVFLGLVAGLMLASSGGFSSWLLGNSGNG
jgi:hypothetical protein